MDLLESWVAFPALLTALAVGCGSLTEAVAGRRLPLALLPALGFAAIVVVAQFLTLADATAELATPAVAALGAAGLVVLVRRRRPPTGWPLAAAAPVFAIYAAPIVLSGDATFAGYIRLDDTATWMALTDRVMEHGRSVDGLAPSTYEATLAFNLADGYPIGVFLPLGVGQQLVGADVAWLIQPYMAWLAAVLALALWSLASHVVSSPAWRAAVAFVAAQSALLFGYSLWGGVKEVAAAMLIAAVVATAPSLNDRRWSWGAAAVAALPCAALVGMLSAGGVLWLAPAFATAALVTAGSLGLGVAALRGLAVTAFVAALSIPVLATGGLLPPRSSPLTDADARGNLLGALDPAQVAGIWPAGDFRVDPDLEWLAYALIALAVLAAALGVVYAWRRRDRGALAYVCGTLGAAALICVLGSPWVDAKALATASPAIPFAAMLAAAALYLGGRRLAGGVLAAVIAGGVLWSNALAYRDVNLAPRERLAELERIGELISGDGPTLMTEYEPYGARHFLREADPEGASELRRRQVALGAGGTAPKGQAVDTDRLDPSGLLIYRSLVLRRSPTQSRPPAPYRLVWAGSAYEVWQRPPGTVTGFERIPLGGERHPLAVPGCADVRQLAAIAARSGTELIAARWPGPIQVPPHRAGYPDAWRVPGSPAHPQPLVPAAVEASVPIPRGGDYEVWLAGSVRPRVDLLVDGQAVGSVRHVLNNQGQYVRLGEHRLDRGKHRLVLDFHGTDLRPGSGGAPTSVGPLMLTRAEAGDANLVRYPPERWRQLCGRAWDWIEIDA